MKNTITFFLLTFFSLATTFANGQTNSGLTDDDKIKIRQVLNQLKLGPNAEVQVIDILLGTFYNDANEAQRAILDELKSAFLQQWQEIVARQNLVAVNIYPTISASQISIDVTAGSYRAVVTDWQGVPICDHEFHVSQNSQYPIGISQYAPGIYYLKLSGPQTNSTVRFIKQ